MRRFGIAPLGTFLVNVSGSFAIGLLSTLLASAWQDRYDTALSALLLTGILGGYTTFSSYELDAMGLAAGKDRRPFAAYWVGSIVAGLVGGVRSGISSASSWRGPVSGRDVLAVFVGGGIGAAWREALCWPSTTCLAGSRCRSSSPTWPRPPSSAWSPATSPRTAWSRGRVKLFVMTGFCGGLSTFSSFIWGTEQLLGDPAQRVTAIVYLVGSMVLGLLLVWARPPGGERIGRGRSTPTP